jgi:hypothetical protein
MYLHHHRHVPQNLDESGHQSRVAMYVARSFRTLPTAPRKNTASSTGSLSLLVFDIFFRSPPQTLYNAFVVVVFAAVWTMETHKYRSNIKNTITMWPMDDDMVLLDVSLVSE